MTQFDVEEGNFKLGTVFGQTIILELAIAYFKYCILLDIEKVDVLKSSKSSVWYPANFFEFVG